MNRPQITAAPSDLAPAKASFLAEAIAGLSSHPRTLPCKFFYDERGARLFQKICNLPEYYITRTEIGILRLKGSEIAQRLGRNIELIGLGTGAGTKTRILLDELDQPAVYVPIDISKEQLLNSTTRFREIFPHLEILPVCADYLEPFELPLPRRPSARSVVYFPGSTIGNFDPKTATAFLTRLADLAGTEGGLLIGVDLQKSRRVLERAYNDSAGVTAEFNLNLLARANRELGANFNLSMWKHRAIYNSTIGRIEMNLISRAAQVVRVAERTFSFAKGEKVVTEHSYKYKPKGFAALAARAGFHFEEMWSDRAGLFGLFYFTVL